MNPLTISIPVNNPPLCPICCNELLGQVIANYGGVMFCQRCILATQYFVLNRVIRRCREPRFSEFFTVGHGLLVLNPKSICRRNHLNKLFDFRQTDTQYDYPQFLGIVSEGYFKASLDYPTSPDDPRHIDFRPAPLESPTPGLGDAFGALVDSP